MLRGGGKEGLYLFGELVRVAAVRVDVTQRGWGASVVEEVHKRVDTFRVTQVEAVTPIMLDMQFTGFSPLFFFSKWILTPRTKQEKDIHVSVVSRLRIIVELMISCHVPCPSRPS